MIEKAFQDYYEDHSSHCYGCGRLNTYGLRIKSFWDGEETVCRFTPRQSRDCFQPIYGLECLDTGEPTYGQPVAFWSAVFEDKVAGASGAIGARSVVFGFPPVLFNPDEIRGAIENVLYSEWQLPVK